MNIKEKLNNFLEKQKKKKPLALASDIFFIVLLLLMLIPASRKEIKTFVTILTMSQPRVNNEKSVKLNNEELSFSFKDQQGNIQSLTDLKGNIVFLNFWATWCPPCRAEMPAIQNLYDEFGDKIKFILISNEDFNIINKYLSENSYTLPSLVPVSNPSGRLESQTIPATFIIGNNGELLVSKKGAAKWDGENIKNLINNQLNNNK